jgi:hypothetical protein
VSDYSTKDAWLGGSGDLREADVEDVPVSGQKVRVRALPARYSAEVQSQMKLETVGREQVAKIDVAEMEVLQFAHGVINPRFTEAESRRIAERYGPAFRKVIEKIDDLSGIDKEAIEQTEQRFPTGGNGSSAPGGDELEPEHGGVSCSARGG